MSETNTAKKDDILEIHKNIRNDLAEIVVLHKKNLDEMGKINGKSYMNIIIDKINNILAGIEMGKNQNLINKDSPLFEINKILGSINKDSDISIKVLGQILTILDKYISEKQL